MLLEHVLEFSKPTLSKYNNVKSNKNAMAGLYVNSNMMCYVPNTNSSHHFKFAIFLRREIREINWSRKFYVTR